MTPLQCSRTLWNQHRKVNTDFLGAASDSFVPFASYGLVPEEVLTKFCEGRADMFLSTTQLIRTFNNVSLLDGVEQTVKQLSLF